MTSLDVLLLATSAAISFLGSFYITRNSVGLGSDHPAHIFMINNIKANKNRLFTTFPLIINETFCGANPMFLHWFLARLDKRRLTTVAKYLNPVTNTLITLSAFLFCYNIPVNFMPQGLFASMVSLAVALTPQFYHAFSARNFGVSSRPLGLLLISFWLMSYFGVVSQPDNLYFLYLTVIVGYLAIAFNTFAFQTILTFSILSAVYYLNWMMLLTTIFSIILFFLLHPKYGPSYLKHTILFSVAYYKELAAVFILQRRYSLWRDFVWDFWVKLKNLPLTKSMSYIYENSVVIILLLNPFFLIAVFFTVTQQTGPGNLLLDYSGKMSLIALTMFILTSFRVTRFYGEPERYIEMASIFSTIAGIYYSYSVFGAFVTAMILLYCFLALVIQLAISKMLGTHLTENNKDHEAIINIIEENFNIDDIRFAANNEEITKHVMMQKWKFVRYWSFGNKLAGFSVKETFYKYPFIRMPVFEKIIKEYKVNVCAVDKNLEGELFQNSPADKARLTKLYNRDNIIIYKISS